MSLGACEGTTRGVCAHILYRSMVSHGPVQEDELVPMVGLRLGTEGSNMSGIGDGPWGGLKSLALFPKW